MTGTAGHGPASTEESPDAAVLWQPIGIDEIEPAIGQADPEWQFQLLAAVGEASSLAR